MKTLCVIFMLCSHGHFKPMNAAVLAAAEVDAATTQNALEDCRNCYESNPIVRPIARNAGIYAFSAGTSILVNWGANEIARHGHPKLAKALQLYVTGLHSIAGIHNMRMAGHR